MAKKFKRARRALSRGYKAAKRYSRSDKTNPLEAVLMGGGYGVARPYIANMVPDVPQLGNYSDNVLIGGAAGLAAWKGKGIVKKLGMSILNNEAFVAASKASSGMTGTKSSMYVI